MSFLLFRNPETKGIFPPSPKLFLFAYFSVFLTKKGLFPARSVSKDYGEKRFSHYGPFRFIVSFFQVDLFCIIKKYSGGRDVFEKYFSVQRLLPCSATQLYFGGSALTLKWGVMMSSASCTAWLARKLWRSQNVIKAPLVQPAFVYFSLSAQP